MVLKTYTKKVLPLLLCFLTSCATNPKHKEEAQLHLQIGTAQLAGGNYPKLVAMAELLDVDGHG